MDEKLATRIREDANEYGATTKRPRDIYYIDLPALSYFSKVSMATHMILTHLDISYPDTPIKVCTKYVDKKGRFLDYRPDQEFLNHALPVYKSFKPWDGEKIKNSSNMNSLSPKAKEYIKFLSQFLSIVPLVLTTGPGRESVINSNYLLF
jgi:adenylosuccinate synthase